MRTQEEILARFEKIDDFFKIQKDILLSYMEFEFAKPFLKENYRKQIENGEIEWKVSTNPKKEILEFLNCVYEKSKEEKGLSAVKNMLHIKTLIWLDDEKFYNEVIDLMSNHTSYGIPALDKISEYYGFVKS